MANESVKLQVLRFKLEVIIHYLEILDSPYHASGGDYTPRGWNLSQAEMIRLLKGEDVASAEKLREALSKLYENHRVRPVIDPQESTPALPSLLQKEK